MNKLKTALMIGGLGLIAATASGCNARDGQERTALASARHVVAINVSEECDELDCVQPTQCLADAIELFNATHTELRGFDVRSNWRLTSNEHTRNANNAITATLQEVSANRCEETGAFIPRQTETLENGN